MARLTLCVIARDEEELLPGCLESVRGFVDRILVVDTGSSDDTVRVAREHGAEVISHVWHDDFAAARNAALAHVDSGYILVLDADERLTRRAAKVVRAAARRGELDLGMLPLHNASRLDASPAEIVSGRARKGEPLALPRLVRRTEDLRWEGVVHESLAEWVARGARKIESLPAPIVHYGAVRSLRDERGKDARNRKLLVQRTTRNPEDPTAWAHLAAEERRIGDDERALEAALRGWEALEQARAGGALHHDPVLPATLAAHLLIDAGRAPEALALLGRARSFGEAHPNLDLLEGLAHERGAAEADDPTAQRSAAEACYRRCLDCDGALFAVEVMPGATSWQAETRLGVVLLCEARYGEARGCFERALRHADAPIDAQLGLAEAMIEQGECDTVLGRIEPLVRAQHLDAWLLAAEAALGIGALDDARTFLETVRSLRGTASFRAPHREARLARVERSIEAQPAPEPSPRRRIIAWPRYDDSAALAALFRDYAPLLIGRDDLCLALRHDAAVDGPAEAAIARLEAAYAAHVPDGALLELLFVDDEVTLRGLMAAACASDVAIELDAAADGKRRAFLDGLRARHVSTPAQLAHALAPVKSSPLTAGQAPTP